MIVEYYVVLLQATQRTIPTMRITSIWVQHYYKGNGELVGESVKVEGISRNVNALKKGMKEYHSKALL